MYPGYTLPEFLRFHEQIDSLNWQFGGEKTLYNFLHRAEFLRHGLIYRTGEITRLPEAGREDLAAFPVKSKLEEMPLDRYVQTAPVNGMIVVHRGQVVFESYPRMRPFDKHLFMSVTKVFVATLFALLADRGEIDEHQVVERYLPEAVGSGWEGVTLRNVLDMASGIDAPEVEEGFTNPDHPYYQFEASLGWLPATPATRRSTYEYVACLPRAHTPGQAFEYTSANTFLLAWIVERQAGMPLNEILTREIWSQIGAQADGLLAVSEFGAPAAHAGMCASLRDLARFGLLFTPSGRKILPSAGLPDSFLEAIQHGGRPELFARGSTGQHIVQALHGEQPAHNSYQWDWVMADGDFFKGGYGGQGLYISPQRDLVIAFFGAPLDEQFEVHDLPWIVRQMVHQGLFEG